MNPQDRDFTINDFNNYQRAKCRFATDNGTYTLLSNAANNLGYWPPILLEADLGIHVRITDYQYPYDEFPEVRLPENWKNFFKALAGPHGKTILKMYHLTKEVPDES